MTLPRLSPHARERLLDVAERLIEELGPGRADRLTVRLVCDAAGLTAPTLYHHFGDKDGLVGAVLARAAAAFGTLGAASAADPADDPIEGFRRGWDAFMDFALAHRGLLALALTRPEVVPVAIAAADALTTSRLAAAADAGTLAVSRLLAADLSRAALRGVLALALEPVDAADGAGIDTDADPRERALAVSRVLREAVVAAVTGGMPG